MNSAVQLKRSGTYDRTQLRPAGQFKTGAQQPAERPLRLLVISDDSQRLGYWRAALPMQHCEVTGLANPQAISQLSQRAFDLAIVDIATAQLAQVLESLRLAYQQIPVFVEASRLPNDLSYAGVLPRYRAMPCVRPDLLRLVKQHCKPADDRVPVRGLL